MCLPITFYPTQNSFWWSSHDTWKGTTNNFIHDINYLERRFPILKKFCTAYSLCLLGACTRLHAFDQKLNIFLWQEGVPLAPSISEILSTSHKAYNAVFPVNQYIVFQPLDLNFSFSKKEEKIQKYAWSQWCQEIKICGFYLHISKYT